MGLWVIAVDAVYLPKARQFVLLRTAPVLVDRKQNLRNPYGKAMDQRQKSPLIVTVSY